MKKACGLVIGGLLLAGVVFMTGCSTPSVLTEYDLPNQALSVRPAEGLSRVVLFNNSNALLYGLDQSGVISIKVDGKGLATLKINDYVQIFLEKGEYDLYLVHRDILSFENSYKLKIDKQNVFVEVFSEPLSTNFKIKDKLPGDFTQKYHPAHTY